MKLLIALAHRFELWMPPEWFAPRLREDFPQLNVVRIPNYDALPRELLDTEIVIAWSIRPEQFVAAKKLKWIHSTAAAVHQLLYPEMIRSKVVLTNARSVHGPVVAEHALALMLAMAKQLPRLRDSQWKKVWAQEAMWNQRPRPSELRGSTVCVVGFGAIGREVALRCHALGMRVTVVREHAEQPSAPAKQVFGFDQVQTAVAQADFMVLAVPVTPETTGFFSGRLFAAMKQSAYLVNVGRGVLVDEAAMTEALQQKRIAGAALDVFTDEPLPANSPLWEMENVLITPHTASITEQLWERHYELISENVRRYLSGNPLLGVVDKAKGY